MKEYTYFIHLNLNPKAIDMNKYPEKHIAAYKYK